MLTVPSRVLQPPSVTYRDRKEVGVRSGGWNMAGIRFNAGGTLRNWAALSITIRRAEDISEWSHVIQSFQQALAQNGLTVNNPVRSRNLPISGADDPSLATMIKAAAGSLDLLLVILPEKITDLYKKIKHVGDVQAGIHTVCVTAKKFGDCNPQYFANVALKFNLKLGGLNQMVESQRFGFIWEDKTMVVGIDVTHPSPDSVGKAPSVAAMVASVNKWLGQWPADLRIQEGRKEMVTELESMLVSRLKLWKILGKHASFPENILVYRDGVSEGQYDQVLEQELLQLRDACKSLYPAPDTKKGLPRITIVVVSKRHNTRFYPTQQGDADDGVSNPKNGTVVDRGITEVRNWDFFLQAHKALQGTARPAHYFIVHDEIFRNMKVPPHLRTTADILEEITHTMCYVYGRATKAVSICPPAYYADIVCERGRAYLTRLFDAEPSDGGEQPTGAEPEQVLVHEKLRNTMFYI